MTANEIMVVWNGAGLSQLPGLHEEVIAAVIEGRPLCEDVADVVAIKIVVGNDKHPVRVIVDFA